MNKEIKIIKIKNSVLRRHGIIRPLIGYIYSDIENYPASRDDEVKLLSNCLEAIRVYNFIKRGGNVCDNEEYLSNYKEIYNFKKTLDNIFQTYLNVIKKDEIDLQFDPNLLDLSSEELEIYTDYFLTNKFIKS